MACLFSHIRYRSKHPAVWLRLVLCSLSMVTKASQMSAGTILQGTDLPYKRIITMALLNFYPLQLPLVSTQSHPLVYRLYFIPCVDCLSSQFSLKLSYFCHCFPLTISFPSARHLSRQDFSSASNASSQGKTLRDSLGGQEDIHPLHPISAASISSSIHFISRLVQVPYQSTSQLWAQTPCSGHQRRPR